MRRCASCMHCLFRVEVPERSSSEDRSLVRRRTRPGRDGEELARAEVHHDGAPDGARNTTPHSDEHALALARGHVRNPFQRRRPSTPGKSPHPSRPRSTERAIGFIPGRRLRSSRSDARETDRAARRRSRFTSSRRDVGERSSRGYARHEGGVAVGISRTTAYSSPESAKKGAHLVRACCTRRVPLVF